MSTSPIFISTDDHSKLRLLLAAAPAHANGATRKLREELDRAAVLDPAAIPPGVVTMDSRVEFEDLGTGEVEDYIVTFPDRARVEEKRLSILAPIGTALLGCREGDVVSWSTPGGLRQLRIRKVNGAERRI